MDGDPQTNKLKPDLKLRLCPRCGKEDVDVVVVTENEDPGSPSGQGDDPDSINIPPVLHCNCASCHQTVGLIVRDEFRSLEQLLKKPSKLDIEDSDNDERRKAGNRLWFPVETEDDRLALYVLNQIIYKLHDSPVEDLLEFEFALPASTDGIKLARVEDGSAVGFYTFKPKGTFDPSTMETYTMPTLDTIFVRSTHRRQGLASAALQDFLGQFPTTQDIGYSHPLSHAMLQVVRKHLEKRVEDRLRFWEITGCGSQGNCRNLWLSLQRKPKKPTPTTTNSGSKS